MDKKFSSVKVNVMIEMNDIGIENKKISDK